MNRRTFLQTGLTGFLAYNCSCARARAANTPLGCRMATSGGSLGVTLREVDPGFLRYLKGDLAGGPQSQFRLKPGLGYYDDVGDPNALADPRSIFPDGPDGTVLMGINFFHELTKDTKEYNKTLAANTVVAHEFGHILQYKMGMSPDGPWQMEPHADFLAGWCLARSTLSSKYADYYKEPFLVEGAIKTFFALGDFGFNNATHHGEPEFRAAMVRAGYDARGLDVNKAFDKGKQMAGLT